MRNALDLPEARAVSRRLRTEGETTRISFFPQVSAAFARIATALLSLSATHCTSTVSATLGSDLGETADRHSCASDLSTVCICSGEMRGVLGCQTDSSHSACACDLGSDDSTVFDADAVADDSALDAGLNEGDVFPQQDSGDGDVVSVRDATPCPAPRLDVFVPPVVPPDCVPVTCAAYARACGVISDGCDGVLHCSPCESPAVRHVDLPLNDIEWDPSRGVLYGSVPSSAGAAGNRVVTISPATASVVRSVFVGTEPNPLALSDDRSLLYVGLDGSATVRAIDLRTGDVRPPFFVGTTGATGENLYALDLAVRPGEPSAVAVVRASTVSTFVQGVSIFDEGSIRPIATPPAFSIVDAIAFDGPSVILGINSHDTGGDFCILSVCANGVNFVGNTPFVVTPFRHELRVNGGLAFHGSLVIDPATRSRIGQYAVPTSDGVPDYFATLPDETTQRTYLVTTPRTAGGISSLIAFARERFDRLDAVSLGSTFGVPRAATGCGPGCMAVLTSIAGSDMRRLSLIQTPFLAERRLP